MSSWVLTIVSLCRSILKLVSISEFSFLVYLSQKVDAFTRSVLTKPVLERSLTHMLHLAEHRRKSAAAAES